MQVFGQQKRTLPGKQLIAAESLLDNARSHAREDSLSIHQSTNREGGKENLPDKVRMQGVSLPRGILPLVIDSFDLQIRQCLPFNGLAWTPWTSGESVPGTPARPTRPKPPQKKKVVNKDVGSIHGGNIFFFYWENLL